MMNSKSVLLFALFCYVWIQSHSSCEEISEEISEDGLQAIRVNTLFQQPGNYTNKTRSLFAALRGSTPTSANPQLWTVLAVTFVVQIAAIRVLEWT